MENSEDMEWLPTSEPALEQPTDLFSRLKFATTEAMALEEAANDLLQFQSQCTYSPQSPRSDSTSSASDANIAYQYPADEMNFSNLNQNQPSQNQPQMPVLEGISYNPELDHIHRNMRETPTDIDSTWYYWVLYFFQIDKLMKKDIVTKLNEMYPWYMSQERTDKSKAIELTRLLKHLDNGSNFRTQKQIVKVSDEDILAALAQLSSIQKSRSVPIRQGDWEKLLTQPINRDTFKRRTGKIIRKKFEKPATKLQALDLLDQVKTIHGPWKIPEWKWYLDEDDRIEESTNMSRPSLSRSG